MSGYRSNDENRLKACNEIWMECTNAADFSMIELFSIITAIAIPSHNNHNAKYHTHTHIKSGIHFSWFNVYGLVYFIAVRVQHESMINKWGDR